MICSTRVDNRLLHGQVAYAWTKELGATCILIANDALVGDAMRKSMMKMAKPEGAKLVFKTIDDSISAIEGGATDPYRLLIVIENVRDAYRLAEGTAAIREINLGNAEPYEGAHAIDKTFFVTVEDEAMLRKLRERGVRVFMQRVPSVPASDYLPAGSN